MRPEFQPIRFVDNEARLLLNERISIYDIDGDIYPLVEMLLSIEHGERLQRERMQEEIKKVLG